MRDQESLSAFLDAPLQLQYCSLHSAFSKYFVVEGNITSAKHPTNVICQYSCTVYCNATMLHSRINLTWVWRWSLTTLTNTVLVFWIAFDRKTITTLSKRCQNVDKKNNNKKPFSVAMVQCTVLQHTSPWTHRPQVTRARRVWPAFEHLNPLTRRDWVKTRICVQALNFW